MNTKDKIKKELLKAFKNVPRASFVLSGLDLCWECEERHLELEKGRTVTIDDIAASCYSYIFYEPNAFEYLIPMLLINAMNQKRDIHDMFPEIFLTKIRNQDEYLWFKSFSMEKKVAIVEALKFIYNLYYMPEYDIWDYDKEEMVYHYKEESLAKEAKLSLDFWQDLIDQLD